MTKNRHKNIIKQLAKSRMNYLFQRANMIFPKNKVLAHRYVFLARRYAQRAKINVPEMWRKRICHKCKNLLYPGNYRIRLQSRKGKGSHVSLTCFECNKTTRYFIKIKN